MSTNRSRYCPTAADAPSDAPNVRVLPPTSASNNWINLVGLVAGLAVLFLGHALGWQAEVAATACLLALAIPIAVLDLAVLRVHLRPSTGLVFGTPVSRVDWGRVAARLFALYATLAVIGLLYWAIPEYDKAFYAPFFTVATYALPVVVVLAIPYAVFVDARLRAPADEYWAVGRCLSGRWRDIDLRKVWHYCLGWTVKGFFIPLMFSLLVRTVASLHDISLENVATGGFRAYWSFTMIVLFLDLLFVTTGYCMTIRLLDAQIRSCNPLVLGWVAALIMYKPFSDVTWAIFDYKNEPDWLHWLADAPVLLAVWAGAIVSFMALWVWANMTFGLRFSNLTHRGILTNGPYRYTKHPSYLAKNTFWWLMAVPFVSSLGALDAATSCGLLLCVNGIYWLRAQTEERHLREDPAYVQYAIWIEHHGLLRWLGRLFPVLRFRRPARITSATHG